MLRRVQTATMRCAVAMGERTASDRLEIVSNTDWMASSSLLMAALFASIFCKCSFNG